MPAGYVVLSMIITLTQLSMLIHCFNVINISVIQKTGCFKSGVSFPGGNFIGSNCQRGNYPGGNYSRVIVKGVNVLGGIS